LIDWKDIPNYEGAYEVSSQGDVRSIKRYNNYKKHSIGDKILSPGITDGYCQVALSKHKSQQQYKIHRLVAQAFIPNPENKPCVNHLDGVKSNNCVDNLEWCTYSENAKHAWDTGLRTLERSNIYKLHGHGENNSNSKLTQHNVDNIRKEYASGAYSYIQLAIKYNVGKSSICRVIRKVNWNG